MFRFFCRSIGLLCLQIHPLRSSQRGAALFVEAGARKQRRAEENQKGKETVGQRDFKTCGHRPDMVHA